MSLLEKIDADLKRAMLAKDGVKVSTLRFLKSAIKYSALEKRLETPGDVEVCQIIQKQVKQHRESIDQFTKGGRKDLAEKESQELKILENYLPAQMSDQELRDFVVGQVGEAGASSKKDFGRMMKILNEKLSGKADSKRISEILGGYLK